MAVCAYVFLHVCIFFYEHVRACECVHKHSYMFKFMIIVKVHSSRHGYCFFFSHLKFTKSHAAIFPLSPCLFHFYSTFFPLPLFLPHVSFTFSTTFLVWAPFFSSFGKMFTHKTLDYQLRHRRQTLFCIIVKYEYSPI